MTIRESAWLVRTPKRASSIRQRPWTSQDVFRESQAPGETPAPAASWCPPLAVSLFSDVTPRARPSTPLLPPSPPSSGSWRPRPCCLQSPGRAGLPPASRPGLRPLALSPTCLCYSSSLPRLASDTAADCKTRSSERPPHLGSAAGARLKPPLAHVGRGARTGARARARVCAAGALIMIWD